MKEKIATLKKLWAIPRYKAFIQLGLYFLFFLIIYLIIVILSLFKEPTTTQPVELSTLDNYINMSNYEYTYHINYINNNQNLTKEIIGTKYEQKNNFKILANKYYIENSAIYNEQGEITNNLNEYDLLELEPSRIKNLIDSSVVNNTTEYKDGKIKKEYSSDFINIITYEEDNYIYKIELDLTNLIKNTNKKISYYVIEISYTNINNINSYN